MLTDCPPGTKVDVKGEGRVWESQENTWCSRPVENTWDVALFFLLARLRSLFPDWSWRPKTLHNKAQVNHAKGVTLIYGNINTGFNNLRNACNK